MNCSSTELDEIYLSALLHDVGKMGIEDKVLRKPGELNEPEWIEMRRHPDNGTQMMKRLLPLGVSDGIMGGVRFHHENWDGSGYPLNLKGEQIPKTARIIAVADAFDAIVSSRPYKAASTQNVAFEKIKNASQTQFDPVIVEALGHILSESL